MTLSDTATARLWETFRAGGGAGLIRDAVELVLQELIEAEAAEAIGAERDERSEQRRTERPDTSLGRRARASPPTSQESSSRRPTWPASTRSVDDLATALGAESGISKSHVSRFCAGLDETVEAFRSRQLDHIEFLWLRDVLSPGVHDLAALLQEVGSPVGRFDGVLDDVR